MAKKAKKIKPNKKQKEKGKKKDKKSEVTLDMLGRKVLPKKLIEQYGLDKAIQVHKNNSVGCYCKGKVTICFFKETDLENLYTSECPHCKKKFYIYI